MNTQRPALLLIDISNSFTKLALARGQRIQRVHRIPTPSWSAASWRATLRALGHPRRLVVSSVVPRASELLRQVRPDAHFLTHRSPLPVGIHYPRPSEIGADRLANAAAARVLYGTPAIVVDFGTAVTFDVIDARGRYLGGAIAPGLDALTRYLHERTALLPAITPAEPRRAIGTSTVAAMRSGTILGFRGLVAALFAALERELPAPRRPVHRIATGGYATLIARHLTPRVTVDPLLTLHGLRLVAEKLPASYTLAP
jgi:type III pantothenate kinase